MGDRIVDSFADSYQIYMPLCVSTVAGAGQLLELDLTPFGNLLTQVFTNFDPSIFSPFDGCLARFELLDALFESEIFRVSWIWLTLNASSGS